MQAQGDVLRETGSRTVAVVGIADNLNDAETQAEHMVSAIKGPLFHRTDIGTAALVQRRIDHMRELRGNG